MYLQVVFLPLKAFWKGLVRLQTECGRFVTVKFISVDCFSSLSTLSVLAKNGSSNSFGAVIEY